MQHIEFLLKGLVVGLIVSIPMGPVGVLCIQKTVNKGRILGFLSGVGAASADTIYAIVAAFGVSYITNFLDKHQATMQIVGIIIFLYLGIRMVSNNPIKQYRYHQSSTRKRNIVKDFLSVFFITLTNPLTIIFFGAAFATLGLLNTIEHPINAYLLILGIFVGASSWWFTLTSLVNIFRKKFRLRNIFIINRLSGYVIIALSVIAFFKLFVFKG